MTRSIFSALVLFAAINTPLHADVEHIDNNKLESLINQGIPIVDVRKPEEWKQTGTIRGSHKLTFFNNSGTANGGEWFKKLKNIANQTQPVILVSAKGNKTYTLSKILSNNEGYQIVYNVKEGIDGWLRAQKPVEK